jgi:hypothetical protein
VLYEICIWLAYFDSKKNRIKEEQEARENMERLLRREEEAKASAPPETEAFHDDNPSSDDGWHDEYPQKDPHFSDELPAIDETLPAGEKPENKPL